MSDQTPELDIIDPDEGDLMTVADFTEAVRQGMLIDYDGQGNWATDLGVDRYSYVKPSAVRFDPASAPPAWATHVLWYNR
jgi:hypothetical protein